MKTTKTFIQLIEQNGYEGETWNFWLQVDDNEAEIEELIKIFDKYNEYYDEDGDIYFELKKEKVKESFVDNLLKLKDSNGYIPLYNKINGKLDIEKIKDDMSKQEEDYNKLDIFYKGGIEKYFIKQN